MGEERRDACKGKFLMLGVSFPQTGPRLPTQVCNPVGACMAECLGRQSADHVVRDSGDQF